VRGVGGGGEGVEEGGGGGVGGDHEARGELAERPAGVHQGGRVGQELERRHHALERGLGGSDLGGGVAHGGLGGGDVLRDPMEQLIGSLDHDAAFARQVAGAQDRESVVGERRKHV